jgi:hypothetical protein
LQRLVVLSELPRLGVTCRNAARDLLPGGLPYSREPGRDEALRDARR